jgi:hypothetical protein
LVYSARGTFEIFSTVDARTLDGVGMLIQWWPVSCLKERGGRLVRGQIVEDIIRFVLDHKLTENTGRDEGGRFDLHSIRMSLE